MKILLTVYKYPFGCIVISVLSLIIFLILGVCDNSEWFGRGGSVIVLFAVAAEYGLVNIHSNEMQRRGESVGSFGSGALSFNMDPPFSKLKIFSHIVVVLGTLIWGFGDWLLIWLEIAPIGE